MEAPSAMSQDPDEIEPAISDRSDRTAGESAQFVEVLSTFNPADVSILRSVLDGQGIDYYFKGEHFSTWRPMVDPARLMVRREQAEIVHAILKDLELSFVAIGRHASLEESPKGRRNNLAVMFIVIFVVIWILTIFFCVVIT